MLLVIKLNGGHAAPQDYETFLERIDYFRDRVILVDGTLTDDGIKSLMRCCDCFVSLHRAEGFGFGLAEAMFLGKPVVGTGYSGNLDFMTEDSACLVRTISCPFDKVSIRTPRAECVGRAGSWSTPSIAPWKTCFPDQVCGVEEAAGAGKSPTSAIARRVCVMLIDCRASD